MRTITAKYASECRRCDAAIEQGQTVVYERRVGVFCLPCAPTDPDEIRTYRTEAVERKAAKYDEWAEKREERASSVLDLPESDYRRDWAFITQPGHIPARARYLKQIEKSWDSLRTAQNMRDKAESLRHVRVAGDAERARQEKREAMDAHVKKGSRVVDFAFGEGVVVGVYKKSYRIKFDRSGSTYARDKSYVKVLS